ncbi:MAG: hypothetical protein WDZ76_13995 [Pseudohongiellaceae bacterium]
MSEEKYEKTEPVEDNFQTSAPASDMHSRFVQDRPPVWIWMGLACLLIIALAVIFILPGVVSRYELPLTPRPETVQVSAPAPQASQETTISPFQEAQRAAQRQEAQAVLAELLEIQGELDLKEVEVWGGDIYDEALEQAAVGDEAYRTQDFIAAREHYEASRNAMASVMEGVPQILERRLRDGETALADNDDDTALENFNLALILDPDNERAAIGKGRAETLENVNGLLAEAATLYEDGDLGAARELYRQAVNLDGYHESATALLAEVNDAIAQREFSGAMSAGYALLQQDQPEQAIAAFEDALAMGVNNTQAQAAISQTENEVAAAAIARHRQKALSAEDSEAWQDAIAAYEGALEIDSNVVFAVNGLDHAQKRNQLDRLLSYAIDNPDRFNDEDVFNETLDVYYTGKAIENPGPRLSTQLAELEGLLTEAQEPVNVAFVSNNETSVTLLRTYDLGEFQEQLVPLKPGRYVAVGTRRGYRDVREEFVVGFGQTPEAVIVQCDERVIASTGR